MNFAKIRPMRVAAGLTQEELAKKLGYATNTVISMWEAGERNPPAEKIPDLAAALHCTINDLFSTEAV